MIVLFTLVACEFRFLIFQTRIGKKKGNNDSMNVNCPILTTMKDLVNYLTSFVILFKGRSR